VHISTPVFDGAREWEILDAIRNAHPNADGVKLVNDVGKEAVVAMLGPGDFFGELSVLDGRPRVAQVVADGPTTCLALASWDLEALLLEDPKISLALLRGLAGRLRDVTEAHRH